MNKYDKRIIELAKYMNKNWSISYRQCLVMARRDLIYRLSKIFA